MTARERVGELQWRWRTGGEGGGLVRLDKRFMDMNPIGVAVGEFGTWLGFSVEGARAIAAALHEAADMAERGVE